mmetsp:Transcript_30236/g.100158  ORF Transcript_30236/g.100158 Transcript_30236/m.100158 type:complete len:415 (-) Transcript_30236:711-1955(-)
MFEFDDLEELERRQELHCSVGTAEGQATPAAAPTDGGSRAGIGVGGAGVGGEDGGPAEEAAWRAALDLRDKDPAVRWDACRELARLGSAARLHIGALECVAKASADEEPSEDVRRVARRALREFNAGVHVRAPAPEAVADILAAQARRALEAAIAAAAGAAPTAGQRTRAKALRAAERGPGSLWDKRAEMASKARSQPLGTTCPSTVAAANLTDVSRCSSRALTSRTTSSSPGSETVSNNFATTSRWIKSSSSSSAAAARTALASPRPATATSARAAARRTRRSGSSKQATISSTTSPSPRLALCANTSRATLRTAADSSSKRPRTASSAAHPPPPPSGQAAAKAPSARTNVCRTPASRCSSFARTTPRALTSLYSTKHSKASTAQPLTTTSSSSNLKMMPSTSVGGGRGQTGC